MYIENRLLFGQGRVEPKGIVGLSRSFSLAYNKACSLSEIPGNFGLAIIVLAFGIIQIY